jgi:hypothetical protein
MNNVNEFRPKEGGLNAVVTGLSKNNVGTLNNVTREDSRYFRENKGISSTPNLMNLKLTVRPRISGTYIGASMDFKKG